MKLLNDTRGYLRRWTDNSICNYHTQQTMTLGLGEFVRI